MSNKVSKRSAKIFLILLLQKDKRREVKKGKCLEHGGDEKEDV